MFLLAPPSHAIQTSDVTSPPGSTKTGDSLSSPPTARRRVQDSSPVSHLFSPPSLEGPSDLSSPLTYATPSSRGGPASNRRYVYYRMQSTFMYSQYSGATPVRRRDDIGSYQHRRVREINLAAPTGDSGGVSAGLLNEAFVIHCTHICVFTLSGLHDYCVLVYQAGDPSTGGGATSEGGSGEAHLVIWGTDVNVQDTKKQFLTFLRGFVDDIQGEEDDELTADSTEPLYLQRLEEVRNNVLSCSSLYLLS